MRRRRTKKRVYSKQKKEVDAERDRSTPRRETRSADKQQSGITQSDVLPTPHNFWRRRKWMRRLTGASTP